MRPAHSKKIMFIIWLLSQARMKRVCLGLVLLLLLPIVSADLVVANSADWKNAYAAGIYARLAGHDFAHLVSPRHSEFLAQQTPPETKILVIESERVPFVRNYASRLSSVGFEVDSLVLSEESFIFELASRLSTRKYLVLDPTYGYDAISVAPYAIATNTFVLFATKNNIVDVVAFLNDHVPERVTMYGDLDKEVRSALADFQPNVINQGNRYKNNLFIADQMQRLTNSRQAILTNGEFLERDMFVAGQPLVFIGRTSPPVEVLRYLRAAPFDAFVLLGNDLMDSAQIIKNDIKRPLFVKFGKGITGSDGYKEVQGLDILLTPIIDLLLKAESVAYNTVTGQIEFIVSNEKFAKTYFIPSIVIQADGRPVVTLGEGVADLIDARETRGLTYGADLAPYLTDNLTAQIFVPYGSTEEAVEYSLSEKMPISIISENDLCDLEINSVSYNKKTQRFAVEVFSAEPCYAQVMVRGVIVNDTTVSPRSETILLNDTTVVEIKQRLDDVDVADNDEITVQLRYGKRENVLTQIIEQRLPLKLVRDISLMVIIAAVIAVLTVIIILWSRKRSRRY